MATSTAHERTLELAGARRRFGYRRLASMRKREGLPMNPKKLYRLYQEGRQTVHKRGGAKGGAYDHAAGAT